MISTNGSLKKSLFVSGYWYWPVIFTEPILQHRHVGTHTLTIITGSLFKGTRQYMTERKVRLMCVCECVWVCVRVWWCWRGQLRGKSYCVSVLAYLSLCQTVLTHLGCRCQCALTYTGTRIAACLQVLVPDLHWTQTCSGCAHCTYESRNRQENKDTI